MASNSSLFNTNSTDNVTSIDPRASGYSVCIFHVVAVTLGTMVIVLNGSVVYISLRERLYSMDQRLYFLTNLAVADLLTGLGFVILSTVVCDPFIPDSVVIVNCVFFLTNYAFYAATWNLVGATVFQLVKVSYPLRSMYLVTEFRLKLVVGLVWCLALAETAVGVGLLGKDSGLNHLTEVGVTTFNLYVLFTVFLVPLTALISMNVRLCVIAYRHCSVHNICPMSQTNRRLQTLHFHGGKSRTDKHSNGCHWRQAVTMVIILGTLVVCWGPSMISEILCIIGTDLCHKKSFVVFFKISTLLYLCNSFCNPLVYTARIDCMRRRRQRCLKKLTSCICRRKL